MTKIKAMRDKILAIMVDDPDAEIKTSGGIILRQKDGTEGSIKPLWFQVYSVGNEIDWLEEGQWVLVDHGRWSRGMKVDDDLKVHLLDNKDCLMVSDEDPMVDDNIQILSRTIPQRPAGDTSRGL